MRELEALHPFARSVWLSRNFGQHAATLAGMASAGGDWIVTLDEDGQHDPSFIAGMLDVALAEQASVVYAHPTNTPPHSALRNLGSRGAKRVVKALSGGADASVFHSYRLILGEVGRSVAAYAGSGVYLDIALGWVAGRVTTAPIELRQEGDRTSGYSLRSLLSHFWRMVLTGGTRGLRLVSVLGVAFAVLGLLVAAFVVYRQLVDPLPTKGWASLIVVILLSTGAILFSLGVIAEYLGVAVNMAMGKPLYLITQDPADGPLGRRPRTSWVVGGSGLLGSAVGRRLRHPGPSRADEPGDLDRPRGRRHAAAQRRDAISRASGSSGGAPARVLWAAPSRSSTRRWPSSRTSWAAGSPGRSRAAACSSPRRPVGCTPGRADRRSPRTTEPVAISAYGRAKLRAEAAVDAFAARTGVSVLLGRLSNLYGPGQDLTKPQGLISQLCRAQLTRRPLSIYVPLDTRRDYLFVDDAAAMAVAGLDAVTDRGGRHLKVLASEHSTTVAAILGDLGRITRRRPLIVLGTNPQARLQARDLRLRSVAWPPTAALARTPMSAGIAATLRSTGSEILAPAALRSRAGPR